MLKPLEVVTNEVSSVDVGKYYLKVELSKLFTSDELRSGVDETVDKLGEYDFWRFLEAMSFTYRLNGIFWAVSNTKYSWSEEIWEPKDITFVRMRPTIDKITLSQEINRNPVKLYEYLKEYFEAHPNDDPEDLGQFRPDPKRPITYSKLFMVEEGEKMKLLDGGNRLIAGLFREHERISAFVGRETNLNGKYRIGDSTFWLLGRTYINAKPEDKDSVLKTIELLIASSTDGKSAAQTYWLPNIEDPELKERCKKLISSAE